MTLANQFHNPKTPDIIDIRTLFSSVSMVTIITKDKPLRNIAHELLDNQFHEDYCAMFYTIERLKERLADRKFLIYSVASTSQRIIVNDLSEQADLTLQYLAQSGYATEAYNYITCPPATRPKEVPFTPYHYSPDWLSVFRSKVRNLRF